jgi:hypothetical protein
VAQPESGMAWKTTSSSAPGRRPPPRATQERARSGLWQARRACSGLDRTWPARRPLEVLSKVRLLCTVAAAVLPWVYMPEMGQAGPDLAAPHRLILDSSGGCC